jgi:alanine dehydrogenase
MLIGIPKEIKTDENRVSLPPAAVGQLVQHGHTVYVERGAGAGSAFGDDEYTRAGATLLDTAAEVWHKAELVVKVKEPQASEYLHLREGLVLFTYLHLAAARELTHAMLDSGVTGVAYETVTDRHGRLPLLEPMSEVAGRMSIQVAAHTLEKKQGGRGVLMGGVPGTRPAHVVVLGGGTVGTQAAKMALGMGAQVTLLDINIDRLRTLDDVLHGRFVTLYSNAANIEQAVYSAKAPRLIRRDMLQHMPEGSVIVDVAVDQGGCVETTRVTTHSQPTYVVDGVVHYGVANMPGAVPRTSSLALSNATLRYVLKIADHGLKDALQSDSGLALGLNLHRGKVTHPAVADTFDLPYAGNEGIL